MAGYMGEQRVSVMVAVPPSVICGAPSPRGVEALAIIAAISEFTVAIAGSATASVSLMRRNMITSDVLHMYIRSSYLYTLLYCF